MYNILYILLHINTKYYNWGLRPQRRDKYQLYCGDEGGALGPTIMYNILYILLHIKPSIIIGALGPKAGIHIYYIVEIKVGP